MNREFITLEEYALCVQECLNNVTHDYQMAPDTEPKVLYATAPIAYAKEQEHFANGSNVGPLITFYQSGIEVLKEQTMGAWKIMPVTSKEGNYMFKAPVICKIKYTVTINALTELEADMLQTQIMMATPFHRPYYTKFNGQFVLIQSEEPTNLSSVEVEQNKDRISKRQLIMFIERAYLHYDIKELYAGTIRPSENIEEVDAEEVLKELPNGAQIMKDGTIKNGIVDKNTAFNGESPYNYRILDENDKVIGTTTKGKIKIKMHSFDGIKKS